MASAGAYSDARMEGHINSKTVAPDVEISKKAADGKTVKTANLAYEEWFTRDQQIRVPFCICLQGCICVDCYVTDGSTGMAGGGKLDHRPEPRTIHKCAPCLVHHAEGQLIRH